MNILDFSGHPAVAGLGDRARRRGRGRRALAESELIGLAPLAAFLAVADRVDAPQDDPVERRLAAAAAFLRLRDFSPMQALELRLEAARAAGPRR